MNLPRCALAGRGFWILHGWNGALILLTTLVLVLGGVSGPQTGYWWLQVIYNNPHGGFIQEGSQVRVKEGEVWSFGALGACIEGEPCPTTLHTPDGFTAAQGALLYHLAAGVLFALAAAVNIILILYSNPKVRSVRTRIWTMCLPVIAYLPVFMAFVADLAVRQNLKSKDSISRVDTLPSFWLSTLALVTSNLYVPFAEWIGYLYDRRAKDEGKQERRRNGKHSSGTGEQSTWAWLSPFGRTAKAPLRSSRERH